MRLLTAQANGNGTSTEYLVGGKNPKELVRTVYCYGTFGGATAKLQISPDNTNWFDATNISFTSAGVLNMEARFQFMRGVVTGGTGEAIDMVVF